MLLLVGHVCRMDNQTNRPVTKRRRFSERKFVLCMGRWRCLEMFLLPKREQRSHSARLQKGTVSYPVSHLSWSAKARVEKPVHVLSTLHGSASYSFGKLLPQRSRARTEPILVLERSNFMLKFQRFWECLFYMWAQLPCENVTSD